MAELAQDLPEVSLPAFLADGRDGVEQAMRHLVEQGRRRVPFRGRGSSAAVRPRSLARVERAGFGQGGVARAERIEDALRVPVELGSRWSRHTP